MNSDILFLEEYPLKEKRLKMDFTKFHCPVCNKTFTENDDVVVCPECGTPHHRECYKSLGKCFNEALHGTDNGVAENYKNPEEKTEKISHSDEADSNNQKAENPFKINEKGLPDFIKFSAVQDHLIEGKHSSLFEAAVGKNQNYYLPRFAVISSLSKGLSLNAIAFLFPFAWSLYRKMYKISALIFAGYLLFFGLSFYNIYSNTDLITAVNDCSVEITENPEAYADYEWLMYEEMGEDLTDAQKRLIVALNNFSVPMYLTVLTYAIRYAPKVLLGIFGNKIYLKKLRKNIEDAEKKGLEGDKLKLYLFKRYGTLPLILAIIVGLIEISLFR